MTTEQMLEGVTPINTPKHNFKNIKEAKNWAKSSIVGIYKNERTEENIQVSKTAIDKYLSESAIRKSLTLDIHLSTLKMLPKLIQTSVLRETQQDRENNKDIKEIQRFYGAINYVNEFYPVKITVKAYTTGSNTAYSYEVLEIESPTILQSSGQSIQSEHL